MTDIWIVTVRERQGVATQLRYRHFVGADDAFADLSSEGINDTFIFARDDFGAQIRVRLSDVASVLWQHIQECAEGDAEVALFQARAQARLQEKADADPVLKAAASKQILAAARQQAAQQPFPWPPAGFKPGGH